MLSTDAGDSRTTYGNQAAQRVLAVLSSFAAAEAPLGVTELARELGMSKNMVHRALSTLVETGWLTRDASGERYQIGFAALLLAGGEPQFALVPLARPYVRRLHAFTGESVFLSVIVGDNRVTIDEIVPPAPGNTPIMNPMMPPRQIGPMDRRHSSRVNQSLPEILTMGADTPL